MALRASAAGQVEDIPTARDGALFPLTPALSLGALGERVNPSRRGVPSRLAGFPPRHLMSGFPLPEGEGQSEGKRRERPAPLSNHSWNCRTERVLRRSRRFPQLIMTKSE